MLTTFRFFFTRLFGFIQNPNKCDYPIITARQKISHVSFYYLLLHFIFGICLWYPVEVAEKLGFFNPLKSVEPDWGIYWEIFVVVFFAPVFEEGIFRLFLGYFRRESYFKWLYYISAFVFGLIHISNYDIDRTHYLFIPFITMTQTFGGLMLGFIRINYGFWYGVLLHGLYNTLTIFWDYIFNI